MSKINKETIQEIANEPVPLWIFMVLFFIVVINLFGEHSERQDQTKSLDHRVTQLEHSHYR